MNFIKRHIATAYAHFRADSLFRNAVYLMASTGIMSVLGFGFWVFVSHLYSPSDIGLASALISMTLLFANLSFLGLNAGLLRFLATSKHRSGDINAVLITVAGASMLAAAGYLLLGGALGGSLALFTSSLWTRAVFVVLMAAVALNIMTDSIFITSRRAEFHTIVYTVFGTVRLVLPLFLIPYGAMGVFLAYIAAVLSSLGLSVFFLRRYCNYQVLTRPHWAFISKSRKYARNNYLGTLLAGLPVQLMPTIIIARLSEASAAYFSMAIAMASLLYVIPSAITNSLLAESSHDISQKSKNIRHASLILAAVLVPAVVLALVAAPILLSLFGEAYVNGGLVVFNFLAVTALAIAGNSVASAILNIEHRSGGNVVVQGTIAAVSLGAALPLTKYGLAGVGLAMLLGQLAGNVVSVVLLKSGGRDEPSGDAKEVAPVTVADGLLEQFSLGVGTGSGTILGGGARLVERGKHKYVLKVYDGAAKPARELIAEHDFTEYLRERGIPVPRMMLTASGSAVAETPGDGIIWRGVVMEFERGDHPQAYSPQLVANMARVQAQMHNLAFDYGRDGGHKVLKKRTLASRLLAAAPRAVSHFDYDGSNLLVEGDEIACVLDFEGMRYDPLVVCVYHTLARLQDATRDPENLRLYLASYQQVRPLNWLERQIIGVTLAVRYMSPRLLRISI